VRAQIVAYAGEYMTFLGAAKTEREAHDVALDMARDKGYVDLDTVPGGALKPGDRVYRTCGGRTLMLAVVGSRPPVDGLRILGGHTDAPRLDLKPTPLYEDGGMAFLDTHYYGGVRHYQWVALPLALHGIVVKQDGTAVHVCIGEDASDPVFVITDLLPHFAKDQAAKPLSEAITGEGLNVLVGSLPLAGTEAAGKVKLQILGLLFERYGIEEEDLASADLEFVPAGLPRNLGLDESMILGYAHDDRVCAYAGLRALLDLEGTPEQTSLVVLCDKEEIGSVGATGMQSSFFENSVAELLDRCGIVDHGLTMRRALERSRMISTDVACMHDPNFADVSSPNNAPYINAGVVVTKYTGARGKSGASEASAEFTAWIRRVLNDAGVAWQTGELGKVDKGGGGTIAQFLARYGMDVIDCGPGVLSMHAPWEVVSRVDAYMTYRAYRAFLEHPEG
jgi:aspartyl aminopeptidase